MDQEKQQVRESAAKIRSLAFKSEGPAAVGSLSARIATLAAEWPEGTASGYLAIGSEMDVTPALGILAQSGWQTCLPVVIAKDTPLTFRAWKSGDELEKGVFGTRHPAINSEITPNLLIVPMLAYDRAGYRMGWGGGFYDRTLEKLRAANPGTIAMGAAYAAQEVDAVPRDHYDQQLDWIVTPRETIRIKRDN